MTLQFQISIIASDLSEKLIKSTEELIKKIKTYRVTYEQSKTNLLEIKFVISNRSKNYFIERKLFSSNFLLQSICRILNLIQL